MTMRILFASSALLVTIVAAARPAAASSAFPEVVREELASASAPSCTVCHSTPSGGFGTATTAFGTYLRSRGLRAGDAASLRTALAAARAERHDSSGDGTPDVEELQAGRDPNAASGDVPPPPEFGCGARVTPRWGPSAVSALASLASLAAIAFVRRRRDSRR